MMAVAALMVPVMAQQCQNCGTGAAASAAAADYASMGASAVDILGGGIFETEGGACRFSTSRSTNFDSVTVGNDKATAFGNYWDHGIFGHQAIAQNNLEVKKNQMSGPATCCQLIAPAAPCRECAPQMNLEQIKLGDRKAFAYGNALAQNNVKIVTNQE